jgi:hypothetical protein
MSTTNLNNDEIVIDEYNSDSDLEDGEIKEDVKHELIISERPKIPLNSRPQYYPSRDNNKQRFSKKNDGNPQEQLFVISEKLLSLSSSQTNQSYEMEAKFGTRGIKQISKIDYDNVIKKLKSLGFRSGNESGDYCLKIQPETIYRGQLSVAGNFDLFRVEINGLLNIQEYCKTNNLKTLNEKSSGSVTILQKYDVRENPSDIENSPIIHSADFDDFNFRVTLKTEKTMFKNNSKVTTLMDTWNSKKKIFRYINRVTYTNTHLFPAFKIDLSIVRSSSKSQGNYGTMVKTINIAESNVFNNPETYEIEIEVINPIALNQYGFRETTSNVFDSHELATDLQKMVRLVLSGLQGTDYPIKYSEQTKVMHEYIKLLLEEEYLKKGEQLDPNKRVYSSNFIGPSSVALQRVNIMPDTSNTSIPNITKPYSYCVTEKADGERHLMYIDPLGKIYLINTNMNVAFTGAKTIEPKLYNTIIDGELITHNKLGQFINKYAAFDVYYLGGGDVRHFPFMYVPGIENEIKKRDEKKETSRRKEKSKNYRLNILQTAIKKMKPMHVNAKISDLETRESTRESTRISCPIEIVSKLFYPSYKEFDEETDNETRQEPYNIFESCQIILNNIKNGIMYNYEVDGLIFTPTKLGVGSNTIMDSGPKKKITWNYSFKWKPSETSEVFAHSYNTIDFLVKTIKDKNNMDVVTPIFESGTNMYESGNMKQFKILQLCVGYNVKDHGYLNPCNDLLNDNYPTLKDNENENEKEYSAKQFYPTDPYDLNAGIANILLKLDGNNSYQMFTEEGETFTDDMIIEFKYEKDLSKSTSWKWSPLRIRYDKTADYRLTKKNFGNNYNVANSTWYSMHYPITENMIISGKNIPDLQVSDDVYYNGMGGEKLTEGLRDFHNLYVKKKLILGASRFSNNLIDFACGKGGDFPKWISAKLSFVLGIDISKDNIENRINGACARFLNFKRMDKNTPYALFVNGNSALNIRSGENMATEKDNRIIRSVFASGQKDANLEPAIERQYGIGNSGFNVSSCQFAIHYMFENKDTFYNFIRNIAECTKLNGHFIATTYDGNKVFDLLKSKRKNEPVEKWIKDSKVWSIQKNYDNTKFENDESSLGYQILVYQDSINKFIPEYLVNSTFFISTMEKYGFRLLERRDCETQFGFRRSTDTFDRLYSTFEEENRQMNKQEYEIEKEYGETMYMSPQEKDISFLNRYYILKKVLNIDASRLTDALINGVSYQAEVNTMEEQYHKEKLADIKRIIEDEPPVQYEFEESKPERPKPLTQATTQATTQDVHDDEDEILVFDDDDNVIPIESSQKDIVEEPPKKSSKKNIVEEPSKASAKKSSKRDVVDESSKPKPSKKDDKPTTTKTRKKRESTGGGIKTVAEMKEMKKSKS